MRKVKCPRPGALLSSRKSCPLFLTTGASLGCGRNCCPHKGRRGTHKFFWRLGITNGAHLRFFTKRINKLLKGVITTCAFVIEHRHSYTRSLHSVNGCFQALVYFLVLASSSYASMALNESSIIPTASSTSAFVITSGGEILMEFP